MAAAPCCTGVVGGCRSRALCLGVRHRSGVGTGTGQRSVATDGLGGGAPGLVSERGRVGGRGLAHSMAPTGSEKVRLCSCGRASVGARALCFVCYRAPGLGRYAQQSAPAGGQAGGTRAALDTRGRCDYARPNAPCRRAQGTRRVPNGEDLHIRASAHAVPGRDVTPGPRSLRRRSTLGIWRCATASLGCNAPAGPGGCGLVECQRP